MIREILHFYAVCPQRLTAAKQREWYRSLAADLQEIQVEKRLSEEFAVVVTPERVAQLLSYFDTLRKKRARITDLGISEELVDDDRTPVEWFIFRCEYTGSDFNGPLGPFEQPIRGLAEYPWVRADRVKLGIHLGGEYFPVFVSESFKAAVEQHQLTGLDFLWCRDAGKYRAPQWYMAVGQQALGRGLDDPRIDVANLSGVGNQTLDPRGRHGQFRAFATQYRRGTGPTDPKLKKLLKLFGSIELPGERAIGASPLVARTFPSYLRRYLPKTDFASTVEDQGDEFGGNSRHRGLAMNRKARDLLTAVGVVRDQDLVPALIVDRPPEGAEDLDRRYGTPEPAYWPEQWARFRELEAQAWAEHMAHPKPPPAPDLARALSLLRLRKRRAPMNFTKPVSPQALAQAADDLRAEIPLAWQKLLRISNGGRIDNSPLADDQAVLILPSEKMARSRRDEVNYFQNIGAEIADSMLLVIETEIGDSIWLDASRLAPGGDCRVVLMSHETGEEREWPGIAEFLEELLTPGEN
jgi:hypothetical protein